MSSRKPLAYFCGLLLIHGLSVYCVLTEHSSDCFLQAGLILVERLQSDARRPEASAIHTIASYATHTLDEQDKWYQKLPSFTCARSSALAPRALPPAHGNGCQLCTRCSAGLGHSLADPIAVKEGYGTTSCIIRCSLATRSARHHLDSRVRGLGALGADPLAASLTVEAADCERGILGAIKRHVGLHLYIIRRS